MDLAKLCTSGRNTLYADTRNDFDAVRDGGRFVVVRLGNDRDEDFLKALLRRMQGVHEVLSIDGLLLVFNGNEDFGRGSVTLDRVRFPSDFPVKVLEVTGDRSTQEGTHTANAPLAYLKNCHGISQGHVWYVSGDVEIDLASLRNAVPHMRQHDFVPFASVRREPAYCAPEGDFILWRRRADDALHSIYWSINDNNPTVAASTYTAMYLQRVCRNTCQAWSLSHLLERRGFDPRCNEWGCPEAAAHLAWLAYRKQFLIRDLPLVEYVDPNLISNDTAVWQRQSDKLMTELEAIRRMITAYVRSGVDFLIPDFDW